MRALRCRAYGSTDDLVIEDIPDPHPGPGEILVDVSAAGINYPDLLVVAGRYQERIPCPFTPGNEAAGTVAAVGAGVRELRIGDRVLALPRGGAFAERCVVDARYAARLPPALDDVTAAGFGVTYGTAYHALRRAALADGERLLVLGAGGGVGSAAVRLGKAMGAYVIAAAGGEAKLAYARAAGADALADYREDGFRDALRGIAASGVDVVLDPVGGPPAQAALRSLGWRGRYLVVGFASGSIPELPANVALLKEASIIGVWWGAWLKRHPDEHRRNLEQLLDWTADGTLAPEVTRSFAFADYALAFRQLAERRSTGKLVLRLRG